MSATMLPLEPHPQETKPMKKLLLATAMLCALASGAHAVQVNLVANPTSATGNFQLAPGVGAFEDQVTFGLIGGPQFITIAGATNTFAGPGDAIVNWVASILSAGLDGIVNNGDDVLLFGPQNASPCPNISNLPGCRRQWSDRCTGTVLRRVHRHRLRHQRLLRQHLDVRGAGSGRGCWPSGIAGVQLARLQLAAPPSHGVTKGPQSKASKRAPAFETETLAQTAP